jgi:TPP-dependent pyruvate/acetoin dehydrogenase alpha subunit
VAKERSNRLLCKEQLKQIDDKITALLDEEVEVAEASPYPAPESASTGVYYEPKAATVEAGD